MRARYSTLLVLLFAVGCLVQRYDVGPAPATSQAGSSGASPSTSGSAGAHVGGGAGNDDGGDGSGACTSTQKLCSGTCVEIDDPQYGCGATSCDASACPAPGEATLSCESGQCAIGGCPAGSKKCAGTCVAIDDPTFGCGDKTCDASTCPDPDQGTLVCNAGKCVVGVCGSGSKQCDDKCVPPDRNHGCNDPNSCDACSTIEVCDVFQRPGCLCQADDVCAGRKCGTYKTRCGTNVTCMDQCKAPAKVCDDGACVECITPDDCEQPGRNPCAVATCKSHQCGFAVASPGTSCRGGTCSATFPGVCERKPIKIDGYSIDAAEVTRGEYLIFIASTDNGVVSGQPPACSWNDTIIPNSIDQDPPMADYDIPVGNIDWCDAYAYCDWAGKHLCGKIGGGPNLFADYNDATKSQWMHACQGPSGNAYAYGNTFDPNRCAGPDAGGPEDVESRTTCVGGYPGLYDMSANIEEWEDSCKAATGATDGCRARGGSFFPNNVPQDAVRCDTNFSYMRSFHGNEMGIRCCGG